MTPVVASLFSGIGGSSLGYLDAGLRVVYALDCDRVARETYELNSGLRPDGRRVEDVSGTDILDAVEEATGSRELHILDGSPPCQSWSSAGKRKMVHDANGGAFSHFIRIVGETKPRTFACENVPGLVQGSARAYLRDFVRGFEATGYRVAARIISGEWHGVPQSRRRLLIVGTRTDTRLDPVELLPVPEPKRTVIRDGLPGIARIVRVAKPPHWPEERTWHGDEPVATITASGLAVWRHKHVLAETTNGDMRPLKIEEVAALCGFPTAFRFPENASYVRRWRGLGNAVPPPMARAWAERIRKALA